MTDYSLVRTAPISDIYPVTVQDLNREYVAWAYARPVMHGTILLSVRLYSEVGGIIMIRRFLSSRSLFRVIKGKVVKRDRWFFDDQLTCVEWAEDGLLVRSKSRDPRRINAIMRAGGYLSFHPESSEGIRGRSKAVTAVLRTKCEKAEIL